MKFAFPIATIVICLVAAYFTLTQAEKFENVQTARLDAISTNKTVSANADLEEAKFEELNAELAAKEDELLVVESRVSNLKSTNNSIKNEVSGLDVQLNVQKAQFDELQSELESVKEQFAEMGEDITVENLGEKTKAFEANIEEKRLMVGKFDEEIEETQTSLDTIKEEIVTLDNRIQARKKRISLNAMEARVAAVNQDWGFIVIGAGSNSGFEPQSALLVKREGRLIGRVRPTSIEPTQTLADIEMKSLSPGVRIQPGDQVILEKPSSN